MVLNLKSAVSNVTKSTLIGKVTSAVKTLVTPSASQAEQNRIKAFGTPSKAVATAAVVGTTALILDIGLTKGAVTKTIVKNPQVTLPVVAGGIVLAGSSELRKDLPKAAATTAKQSVNVLYGVGTAYDTLQNEGIKEAGMSLGSTIKENPFGSALLGVAALGTSAAGIYYGTKLIGNIGKETKENIITPDIPKVKDLPKESIKETALTTSANKPMTPELIKLDNRKVSTGARKTSKRAPSIFAPSLRVTINNQNKNTKFIKFSKYTN